MTLAAIVGGTASKLGGGKFANGAVSGAFVHIYNWTAHWTVSGTAGAGGGGTAEFGPIIAHDSSKPWYTGWSIGLLTTEGAGAFAGVDAGVETTFGYSDNSHVSDLTGWSTTSGASGNVLGANGGYESSNPDGTQFQPVNAIYMGGKASIVPYETHLFRTHTQISMVSSW
jgi:hypothetical protein